MRLGAGAADSRVGKVLARSVIEAGFWGPGNPVPIRVGPLAGRKGEFPMARLFLTGRKPKQIESRSASKRERPVAVKRQSPSAAELAYELWQRRGRPRNDDWTDWFEAERIIASGVGMGENP